MKEGDIVICIDSSDHVNRQKLTYGKRYTIKRVIYDIYGNSNISIINDDGVIGSYNTVYRFITLDEWRERRLIQIGL